MKNKKVLVLVVLMVVGLIFGIGAKIYKSGQAKKASFLAQENAKAFIPDHAPRLGGDEAEVFIVEYLDPECESCREMHPLVKSIMNEFKGKVQLIVRYAPFHTNSILAVKILEASRKQGKYWEALQVLFEHQPLWGSHHDPRPELMWKYLPKAGVDVERARRELEDPQVDKQIQQDIDDGELLGVRGTPTFFVNGKSVEEFGYGPLRQMVINELSASSTR